MKRLQCLLLLALFLPCAHAEYTKLELAAMKEGQLDTLGMPDHWANWGGIWADLQRKYHINQQDTDMTSGQAISKMRAEGKNATSDMCEAGFVFAPIAKALGITQPFKPSTWDEIPDWAKDSDGDWVVDYMGTIAFMVDKTLCKHPPRSWKELLDGKCSVAIGEVGSGGQPTNGVLAAAIAMGGSEEDLTPGINLFTQLAKENRLSLARPEIANFEKGEIEVGVIWDFNALNYRKLIDPQRFDVFIPADGSVISGYTTLINKYAKHPNAAKLAREYVLSDAGQIEMVKGHARPIRDIKLPPGLEENLLPKEQYVNARHIKNPSAWRESVRELPMVWQEKVLIHVQ